MQVVGTLHVDLWHSSSFVGSRGRDLSSASASSQSSTKHLGGKRCTAAQTALISQTTFPTFRRNRLKGRAYRRGLLNPGCSLSARRSPLFVFETLCIQIHSGSQLPPTPVQHSLHLGFENQAVPQRHVIFDLLEPGPDDSVRHAGQGREYFASALTVLQSSAKRQNRHVPSRGP